MPTVQTTFNEDCGSGYAGMIADGETDNRISRTLEDATPLAFGKAVFAGAGDHGCTGTPNARPLGFAIADHGLPVTTGRPADTYAKPDTVAVKNGGSIWVDFSVAADDGDAVFVTGAGLLTKVSGGNTVMTGWEVKDTITAPGLTRVVRR